MKSLSLLLVVLATKLHTAFPFRHNLSLMPKLRTSIPLYDGTMDPKEFGVTSKVARLNAMAAKLRAEAAVLEAEQKQEMVQTLAELFSSFDTNQDGKISMQELRDGLKRVVNDKINEDQAIKIMKLLDKSGDGALQLEEFQSVDNFRTNFEKILLEERKLADEAQQTAFLAKQQADKAEAISALINNKPPTGLDRILSILPFLLPLLDSLPYAGSIIEELKLNSNPLVGIIAFLYVVYQTVPFAGLIAFFLFNALSTNLQLNRLIRYNIQLAISLDIALVIPGLISTIFAFINQSFQNGLLPAGMADYASDATFITCVSVISYAIISSLQGKEPDQIPILSNRIRERVPTTEEFQKYYDEYEARVKEEEEKKKNNDKFT